MKKTLSIVIFVVLLIIIILMYFGVKNQKQEVVKISEREQIQEQNTVAPKKTLTVKHQYRDGAHTYVGSIDIPSPCHTLSTDVTQNNEENTAVVKLVIKQPVADALCAQVITPTPFEVTFKTPENREVFFTVDGAAVNINQFEVPPAQKIDTADLYIKG